MQRATEALLGGSAEIREFGLHGHKRTCPPILLVSPQSEVTTAAQLVATATAGPSRPWDTEAPRRAVGPYWMQLRVISPINKHFSRWEGSAVDIHEL